MVEQAGAAPDAYFTLHDETGSDCGTVFEQDESTPLARHNIEETREVARAYAKCEDILGIH
jgi:hypothetical protein